MYSIPQRHDDKGYSHYQIRLIWTQLNRTRDHQTSETTSRNNPYLILHFGCQNLKTGSQTITKQTITRQLTSTLCQGTGRCIWGKLKVHSLSTTNPNFDLWNVVSFDSHFSGFMSLHLGNIEESRLVSTRFFQAVVPATLRVPEVFRDLRHHWTPPEASWKIKRFQPRDQKSRPSRQYLSQYHDITMLVQYHNITVPCQFRSVPWPWPVHPVEVPLRKANQFLHPPGRYQQNGLWFMFMARKYVWVVDMPNFRCLETHIFVLTCREKRWFFQASSTRHFGQGGRSCDGTMLGLENIFLFPKFFKWLFFWTTLASSKIAGWSWNTCDPTACAWWGSGLQVVVDQGGSCKFRCGLRMHMTWSSPSYVFWSSSVWKL